MKLRLPPNVLIAPAASLFRKDRLPPELFETWILLVALAWVTRGKVTPPTSVRELTEADGTIEERTMRVRLLRLEELGWLRVERTSGQTNLYYPIVPPDRPAASREPASGYPSDATAVAPRCSESGTEPNSALDIRGVPSNIAAAAVNALPAFTNALKQKAEEETAAAADSDSVFARARTREERMRIEDALYDLGLVDDDAFEEVLALAHVSVEYLEDWVAFSLHNRHLGPGYYRMQIRHGRVSSYLFRDEERVDYRRRNDDEHEREREARERERAAKESGREQE